MNKRILHLIPTLQGGGAEQQLVLLCRQLRSIGWDVAVGYVQPGIHLDSAIRSGAQIERLQARNNYDPALPYRVRQLIRQFQPAIVQTWLPQMDIIGGLMSRVVGVPWVVSDRSTRPLEGRPLTAFARDRIMSGASAVISNSSQALEPWIHHRPSVPRFHIPNVVSLTDIDTIGSSSRVASLRKEPEVRVAVSVGRLVDLKRFDIFIEAMKRVCAVTPAAALLCGEGPLKESLEARVQRSGLADRFLFSGFVPDVVSDIKSADALVALSRYEGRPNVVIEAMACRTPLVVSDIAEHREFLTEHSARFVGGSDPDEVAASILDVFRDRDTAVARAAHARQIAEQWSPNRIVGQYEAAYREILQRRRL